MRERRPPPKTGLAARPWLLVLFLLALGLIVWSAWPEAPRSEVPARPLAALYDDAGRIREALAIRVRIGESDSTQPACPCFEVRMGEKTWLLEEPGEHLTIPETDEAWKALARQYETFTAEFAEATRALRGREPDRRFGVIEIDAPVAEGWPAAVEIVVDAFLDADVRDTVVEAPEPEGRTMPADRR